MTLNVAKTRADLIRQLRKAPKASSPSDLKSYLGSPVPVLGVSVPQLRSIIAAFWKGHRDIRVQELNRLGAAVWRGRTFDEKALAIGLIDANAVILDDASWRLLDTWVDEASGWGLCDWLGSGPVTKMVYSRPARFQEILRWTKSKNHWRRRISAYAVRDFVFAGMLEKPFRLLERLLYDEEFWVQRAVGTWLRECWKKDRPRTERFLRDHARGLPKVVITVATERAPKAFRDELRRRREKRA